MRHGNSIIWLVIGVTGIISNVKTQTCSRGCECTQTETETLSYQISCSLINAIHVELPQRTQSINFVSVFSDELHEDHFAGSSIYLTSVSWVNSGIVHVARDAFRGLINVHYLNLSGNNITEIWGALEYLEKLKILNLTDNSISSVIGEKEIPSSIEELYLSRNHIQEIDGHSWSTGDHLKVLDISNNQISNIDETAFRNLPKLQKLVLSNNRIELVRPTLFNSLIQLEYLDLSGNSIQYVPRDIFHGTNSLKYLNLGRNELTTLPPLVFQYSNNLNILKVDRNRLQVLNGDNLYGLINLSHLSLEENAMLREISAEALSYTLNLEYLDVRGSNLTWIPKSIAKLSMLKTVLVNETEIGCSCKNFAYVNWKWENGKESTVDERCREKLNERNCRNEKVIERLVVELGTSTLIPCNATSAFANISWTTPTGKHEGSTVHDRVYLLPNGSLYINHVLREDSGLYICQSNDSFNTKFTYYVFQLDPITFQRTKIMSILTGLFSATGFLTLTIVVQMFRKLLKRCGCCKRRDNDNAPSQMVHAIENIEQYKTHQLEKLRENYTQQVHKIKENCATQVGWICDSYQNQVRNLKDIRDYGTSHLSSLKDNYYEQVKRVKEYSNTQLSWVQENYVFQRNRIRKFRTHQLLRLRESCKYQQQTLNKLLENLPSLYLDHCRSGSCSKSDSADVEDQANVDFEVYFKSDLPPEPGEVRSDIEDENAECTPPREKYLRRLCLLPQDPEERVIDKRVYCAIPRDIDYPRTARHNERRSTDLTHVQYRPVPNRAVSLPEIKKLSRNDSQIRNNSKAIGDTIMMKGGVTEKVAKETAL